MDEIQVNPKHISNINVKEFVFSGGINDYGAIQSGVDCVVCIAPYAMRLKSFIIRADTLESGGGTVDVKKTPSGIGISGAVDMVVQVVPTASTLSPRSNYAMELHATEANYTVGAGDLVVIRVGATGELTGLAWIGIFERI